MTSWILNAAGERIAENEELSPEALDRRHARRLASLTGCDFLAARVAAPLDGARRMGPPSRRVSRPYALGHTMLVACFGPSNPLP